MDQGVATRLEIADLGKQPIPGAAPAGTSARYEPEYEQVGAEISKLDSLHGDAVAIDWSRVTELASEILSHKSKDLAVATYLCLGLFHTRGYAGLAQGIEVVADLLDGFWEGLFPELVRLRGRVNAVIWLGERGGSAVVARRPQANESEALQACSQAVQRLDEVVARRFGPEGPSLADLRRGLREYLDAREAAARKAEAAAKAVAAPAAAGTGTYTTVREAHEVLLRIASFLRQQSAHDPLAFRLPRAVRWGALTQPPPAAPDGKTGIPAVPPQVREPLARVREAANWAALLDQAEARFPEAPLWLDLQYSVDVAMNGLGAEYAGARHAVRQELAAVLERIPRLRELRFADGTPFADAATQTWIESEVLRAPAAAAASPAGAGLEFIEEARRLFAQGKIPEALTMVQQEMNGVSARERFLARLEVAKLCQGSGRQRLAFRLLEALDQEMTRFSLDEWEPALAVHVLKLLYQCRRAEASAKNPEAARSADELYRRLCRLDLLSALALEGS